jgi:SecD/SecF fusion protein
MKNKGLVIFLAVLFSALCLFYLSFTFIARNIENDATAKATVNGVLNYEAKQRYLDSMWNVQVFDLFGAAFTYKEVKEQELTYGLDLQGGMHVILEVSPDDIILALAGNSRDENLKKAIAYANKSQATSRKNFTELFFEEFERTAGKGQLAKVFVNSGNRGRIDFQSSDEEVKKYITAEVESAIDRAFEIIRSRVDKFGVSQPNVQRIQGTGRVQVELPGVSNPERVRKLLQGVAKLEFWEVWNPNDLAPHLMAANDYWVKKGKAKEAAKETEKVEEKPADSVKTEKKDDDLFASDSSKNEQAKKDEADTTKNNLEAEYSELLTRRVNMGRGDLVYEAGDTAKINRIILDKGVRGVMANDLKFAWSVKPIAEADGKSFYSLYALKSSRGNNQAALSGDVVTDATPGFDDRGRPDVNMMMNAEGAKKWKKITGENIGNQIAIVLDGYVYSAPVVQSEIGGGRSSISGSFSIEEAKDLANILKAGKLPAKTRIVEEAVVGPSLGVEAQKQGLISIALGFALVVIFTLAYYAKAGIVANIALLVNVFFIFGILANLNAALTLPGIAGIVLTIGMAIDSNVLIFERVREEMRNGLSLKDAIAAGYDRALLTIIDANLTTFLTAVILFVLGVGPIQGFATTLMVGIASSFFTSVFLSRVLIEFLTKKGENESNAFGIPATLNMFQSVNFDFIGKRKAAYIFSGIFIVLSLALSLRPGGLNYGVDFLGGRSFVVEFNGAVVPSEIKVELDKTLGSTEVKSFNGQEKAKITTTYLMEDESAEADEKVQKAVTDGLSKYSNLNPRIVSFSKVGATIADDIKDASFMAISVSLLALFAYIVLRFRRWQFGLGAVLALAHDALFVIGCFALAHLLGINFEIDQVFVAAILTVIGYSINDTVVVFDHVREHIKDPEYSDPKKAINSALNNTLGRTILTTTTTLLVVLTLMLFGGEVLRGFSFALMVGVVVGTYSSLFIASPLVFDTSKGNMEALASTEGRYVKKEDFLDAEGESENADGVKA